MIDESSPVIMQVTAIQRLREEVLELRSERDALRKDGARLDWLADSQEIEGFANDSKDLYEYAAIVADERGHDGDLTVSDQREGFRRMIDAALAVQP